MKRNIRLVIALATALLVTLPAGSALAQTVPPPPDDLCDFQCPVIRPFGTVVVESYEVDVEIDSQIAVTHVTQVLRNDGHTPAEGVFLFPFPKGAAASDLVLWIDNEPIKAEVLSADEAREIYQDIVRTLRDPALLEWVDRDLLRLSVFPIPAGEERVVEVEYVQVLTADAGLIRYAHPLGAEHGAGRPIEQVSVRVEVDSNAPIRAVYSPTHVVDVDRSGENSFVATYEDRNVEPQDEFALFYSVSEDAIDINVISYRDGDNEAGFFTMLITPTVDDDRAPVPKDVLLVLDRSGSMEGEKFAQAQEALTFVLDNLNDEDRFNIVTFSSSIRSYAPDLRPAGDAGDAKTWVQSRAARGSTDINRALLEAFAMADDERPTYVIFLTDGLPTEGVTSVDRILDNAMEQSRRNVSFFTFGVGFDVDALLLDSLAEDHHGTSSYVLPNEDIDEVVSGFYAKVSSPVLTQIEIDFGDAGVFDTHPAELSDLFAGEQLTVTGRYLKPGLTTVSLTGFVGNVERTFTYEDTRFGVSGGEDFVPRLWATRKIGDLLREMRFEGASDETVDQIVQLATRYGIVTPFTSFLVTEPGMLDADGLARESEALLDDVDNSLKLTSGEGAVDYSSSAGDLAAAEAPATAVPTDADYEQVVEMRNASSHTFRLVDGVWVDTAFDPNDMSTVRVPFLSDGYFALAGSTPVLTDAFALGERVIVAYAGTAYEVVGAEEPGDPIMLPLPAEPDPTADPGPLAPPPVDPPAADPAVLNLPAPVADGPQPTGSTGGHTVPLAVGGAALFAMAGLLIVRRRRNHRVTSDPGLL
jgi:Ca-activated chloride channel family protein